MDGKGNLNEPNLSEATGEGTESLSGNQNSLNFQRALTIMRMKVHSDLNQLGQSINQEFLSLIELFDEVLATRHNMLYEAAQKSREMEQILQKTENVHSAKQAELIDCLNACFNSGPWIKQTVNPHSIADIKNMLKNYAKVDFTGVTKLENIVDKFLSDSISLTQDHHSTSSPNHCLVAVTNVVDPGEFYVIQWNNREKYELISSTLEAEASKYPEPSEIVEGKMYAVCSSDKWYRGVCGRKCGIYQMGHGPLQQLYSFFFVDEGHIQTIPSSLIRCLPEELQNIPKLALECALIPEFKSMPHNIEINNRFKQATYRNPMSMKILNLVAGKLIVDLSQIPRFAEDTYIASLRDALFQAQKVEEGKQVFRKFKPKLDIGAASYTQPKALRVLVSHAQNPLNVYVNIIDEEKTQFEQMNSELQAELADAQPDLPQDICKGHVCAAKFKNVWYRVLVEEVDHRNDEVPIFYVDTGHRETISKKNCYHLPDKFLELPAQSLRCVLDGLKSATPERQHRSKSHSRPAKWTKAAASYVQQAIGKKGILDVENVNGRLVGKLDRSTELTVFGILYIDGEKFSLNHQLCAKGLATCRKRTVAANIDVLRQELAPETVVAESTVAGDGNLDSGHYEAAEQASGEGRPSQENENEKRCEDRSPDKSSPEDLSKSVEDTSLGEPLFQHDSESSIAQEPTLPVEITTSTPSKQDEPNVSTDGSSLEVDSGIVETSIDGLRASPKPVAQLREMVSIEKGEPSSPEVTEEITSSEEKPSTSDSKPLTDDEKPSLTIEPSSPEQPEEVTLSGENASAPDYKPSAGEDLSAKPSDTTEPSPPEQLEEIVCPEEKTSVPDSNPSTSEELSAKPSDTIEPSPSEEQETIIPEELTVIDDSKSNGEEIS